ncbi:hypothetical protein ACO0K3_15240 [Undibacterium sp. Rencai35W]|uniref:hypothetical protein n=1 Tax=Undibacterium sp. Rencai35W TaxID=3413046 RepID=UPI003BF26B28
MYAIFKHIKLIALQDLRLYFAPFIGAVKAVKVELARPKRSGIKNIVADDIRLFFSPLIGAIDEIKRELKR